MRDGMSHDVFRCLPKFFVAALGFGGFLGSTTFAKNPIVSSGGGFVLHGNASFSTSHFSRKLSDFEARFGKLTGFSDAAPPPVVVVLSDVTDAPLAHASLRMDALENGQPKIQVNLDSQNLEDEECFQTLAQSLLLRAYYGEKAPSPGSPITIIPPWLTHGLGRLCNSEALPVVIPAHYLRGAVPPSIADLLVQKPPSRNNPTLLDIYDAMASSLVRAGLMSPGGSDALQRWIGHFDPGSPDRTLSGWPPDWNMQSLERRWLLLMAGTSGEAPSVISLLTVGETLRRYDEIIMSIPTAGNAFDLLKREKGSPYIVRGISKSLLSLHLQANPLVVPLLDETLELCGKLPRLPEKKILERQKKLIERRAAILKQARDIESYLDWYEAARLPISSGLFDKLLHAPDTPVSKGPVGHYLDQVEQSGW